MPVTAKINWWPKAECAKAFWGQQHLAPYQQLLADTVELADPQPGERWLDLGCGGGSIARAIWERTAGTVDSVVGIDCAAANGRAWDNLRATLDPAPGDRIRFREHDFSRGLDPFADETFDNAVSGLSISYAESFDEATGRWTTGAYDRLMAEVFRVLRPGGRFVFSVNVPNPSWAKVGASSLGGLLRTPRVLESLKRSWRMLRYGRWLKREARAGRFHYLPAAEVARHLALAGFVGISHRLSYLDQAYVFTAAKTI